MNKKIIIEFNEETQEITCICNELGMLQTIAVLESMKASYINDWLNPVKNTKRINSAPIL